MTGSSNDGRRQQLAPVLAALLIPVDTIFTVARLWEFPEGPVSDMIVPIVLLAFMIPVLGLPQIFMWRAVRRTKSRGSHSAFLLISLLAIGLFFAFLSTTDPTGRASAVLALPFVSILLALIAGGAARLWLNGQRR